MAKRFRDLRGKTQKPSRILLDADYLVYAAGFAAQHTYYLLANGEDQLPFDNKADLKAAMQDADAAGLYDTYTVWERTEVEPVENALHTVKLQIERVVESITERFGKEQRLEVYLTGTGNFREKIATIKPYKGNRDPRHKPALFREIRGYLQGRWGAEVIHDMEADDKVCIEQTRGGGKTIIAGIDKDLLQCPGWHYNADKDAFAYVDEQLGARLLYRQIISGDPTDNIGGVYKLGVGKAKKIVDEVMDVKWPGAKLEFQTGKLYDAALQAYVDSIERYRDMTGYAHMAPEDALRENARLVYMLRSEHDQWKEPIE